MKFAVLKDDYLIPGSVIDEPTGKPPQYLKDMAVRVNGSVVPVNSMVQDTEISKGTSLYRRDHSREGCFYEVTDVSKEERQHLRKAFRPAYRYEESDIKYCGFYTRRSISIISMCNSTSQEIESPNYRHKVVYKYKTGKFEIYVAKDGMLALNISYLENQSPMMWLDPIEEIMEWWGSYYSCLNAYLFVLDICAIQEHKFSLGISELSMSNVVRVYISDDGYIKGGGGNTENLAVKKFVDDTDIHKWNGISLSVSTLNLACKIYEECLRYPWVIEYIQLLTKSIVEYHKGCYATSLIFSWSAIENIITDKMIDHIDSINFEYDNGRKRFNSNRKDVYLRNNSIQKRIDLLELLGLIDDNEMKTLNELREKRNSIIHKKLKDDRLIITTANDCVTAIEYVMRFLQQKIGNQLNEIGLKSILADLNYPIINP